MVMTRERAAVVKVAGRRPTVERGKAPALEPRIGAMLAVVMPDTDRGWEGPTYTLSPLDLPRQTDRRILGGWVLDSDPDVWRPARVAVVVTPGGITCTCPRGRDRTGCPHVRALLKFGLVSHPGRVNAVVRDLIVKF